MAAARLIAALSLALLVFAAASLGAAAYTKVTRERDNSGPHAYTRINGTYVETGFGDYESWAEGDYIVIDTAPVVVYAHFEYIGNNGYYYVYHVERLNGFLDYRNFTHSQTGVYKVKLNAWATLGAKNGPVEAPVTVTLP